MQNPLLDHEPILDELLPSALSKQIRANAEQTLYRDGQLIQTRGDTHSGLCIVRSGALRVGNQGKDGSYLTTSNLTPGHCYGEFTLLAGLPRTHEMVAIGNTAIDKISKTKFMRLYDAEPELARALLKISLIRNHALLEFVDDMRRLSLPVHVAKLIFRAAAGEKTINIRQEDLAFTFGVSRVSMGKVLKRLASLKLLKLGYGKIEIGSHEKFQAWLQEESLIEPLAPDLGDTG